ncbi:general substrate transporter [Myxozyma melibiosi]|uniref:General substrate transporter n=1 Tax=Myxozyma melibiosi TaxID=54550 RepID=A0ABR1FCU0_9ASCO
MHSTTVIPPELLGEDYKPHITRRNLAYVFLGSFGSFMFGYANNVTTGSLAQTSFINKFLGGGNSAEVISGILGGFLGGAFLGSVIQARISAKFGRRITTAIAAMLLIIAGALMAGSEHIAMFITFRIISGIGAGILTTNCPVYLSEIAPFHLRGLLTGVHGVSINVAYTMSSLIALGLSFLDQAFQWRIQFCIFVFFSIVLLGSVFFLPESPRWLIEQSRYDEALDILRKLHVSAGIGEVVALAEMAQIKAQVDAERSQPSSYWHIFTTKSLRKRAIVSIVTFILCIGSGILVIANLTPILFGGLGFDQTVQLGLSAVWVFQSGCGSLINAFLVDRVGRRPLFLTGGCLVAVMLIIEAVLQKYYLGTTYAPGLNAATAFFFLYDLVWASCVDNTSIIYIPEIWPTHLRSYGASIAYCSYYAVSIAITSPASLAFDQIGYRYYFVFLVIDILALIYVYFEFPEVSFFSYLILILRAVLI